MASENVNPPQVAATEGAPAQELPSRPAKQPKEKGGKDKGGKGKNAGLEVRLFNDPTPRLSHFALLMELKANEHGLTSNPPLVVAT